MGMMTPVIGFLDERLARVDDPVRQTVNSFRAPVRCSPMRATTLTACCITSARPPSDRASFFTPAEPIRFSQRRMMLDPLERAGGCRAIAAPGPVVLAEAGGRYAR
jgi:hypothetical protein